MRHKIAKGALEIERKFLVTGEFRNEPGKTFRIIQGYLSSIPARTVRVRLKDDRGFITVKGSGNESGATRFEWEKEITHAEAEELLKICEPGIIEKTRYEVVHGNHLFEIDVFLDVFDDVTVKVDITFFSVIATAFSMADD